MKGNSKAVSKGVRPKWYACEFGKVDHWPNKIKTTNTNHIEQQYNSNKNLLHRHMVYNDHYILQAPRRIYQTKGKPSTYEMFSGKCVFVDNYIGYVIIKHKVVINATENFKDKLTS